jgi:uncharacterized protein YndB with AHSA1/START domain
MPASDVVTVSVNVSVEPALAFAIFTEETDLWWRRGPKYRIAGKERGRLNFEPRLGGIFTEEFESPAGPQTFTMGEITVWQPPDRFQFEWRGINFAPGESTRVDVSFVSVPGGTRVTVRHSGWSALPLDHPVRHGQSGVDFLRATGLWWADLLTALRESVIELRAEKN